METQNNLEETEEEPEEEEATFEEDYNSPFEAGSFFPSEEDFNEALGLY